MRRLAVDCQRLFWGTHEKARPWLSEAVWDTREGLELGCQRLFGTHEKA